MECGGQGPDCDPTWATTGSGSPAETSSRSTTGRTDGSTSRASRSTLRSPRRRLQIRRPQRVSRGMAGLPGAERHRRRPGSRVRLSTAKPRVACDHGSLAACSHLDSIERLELPEPVAGCEDCLADGTRWVHLRMCQTCGHIGCCDNSPGRHATAHYVASGHPIIRSAEPGEDWSWCYVDELMFRLRPS